MPTLSVIIATHNQRERVELVLCGLLAQTLPQDQFEVVVVNDGSTDGTAEMLRRTPFDNLTVVDNGENRGRCGARNAGIERASGELAVFLDGDALPCPELLATYLASHAEGGAAALCGFQYSLPHLEHYQDPQTGSLADAPLPSVMKDFLTVNRRRFAIDKETVLGDFARVHRQAVAGGYPFPSIAKSQRALFDLYRDRPGAEILWLGFFPHNGAVPLRYLREAGGFDTQIPFCEGWELAYRLHRDGFAIRLLEEAASYHLYHRHDFTDPAKSEREMRLRVSSLEYMADKHRDPRVRLLYFFAPYFSALHRWLPREAVIDDIGQLADAYGGAGGARWEDLQSVLAHNPQLEDMLAAGGP